MAHPVLRFIYALCGLISLVVGIVGAFLPILPTTPLVLLAAFFFSRSSPWLHRKLLNNRLMGGMIRNWQHHGAIGRRAKVSATGLMAGLFVLTAIYVPVAVLVKVLVAVVCSSVLVFIWTRPSGPPKSGEETPPERASP
ncbi:MAG: YbaN family protein [SAR324 cluster bacterium]|nr:YbaN family protein [SAR324 cluster bacterium]